MKIFEKFKFEFDMLHIYLDFINARSQGLLKKGGLVGKKFGFLILIIYL